MTSGLLQENSFIVITLNPESNCTCRETIEANRRYQNNIFITGRVVWWKCWRLLERGWGNRIVRYGEDSQEICFIKRKATWRIYMVREEADEETNDLKTRQCMARYVEAHVWCSEKESKTKMGYRETKARQCQTVDRNILHWTKRRRVQAHNESRSQKVGSSDASSNALQKKRQKQWWNPPQYWETQDEIHACVDDADESTRPRLEGAGHKPRQDHITAKGMNSITHYSLEHKFIPMPQTSKIPDAKAAVEK